MRNPWFGAALLVAFGLGAVSCAFLAERRESRLNSEIIELNNDLDALRSAVIDLKGANDHMRSGSCGQ